MKSTIALAVRHKSDPTGQKPPLPRGEPRCHRLDRAGGQAVNGLAQEHRYPDYTPQCDNHALHRAGYARPSPGVQPLGLAVPPRRVMSC